MLLDGEIKGLKMRVETGEARAQNDSVD